VSERIDHRSIEAQHNEALEHAAITLDAEEKALWLAKATATSRPAMQRVHRAKWNSRRVQEKRAAEQAVRDEMKQEAQATYSVFKDLDLQIVVDLRSLPYRSFLNLLKSSYLKYNLEQSSLRQVHSQHHQKTKSLFWLPLRLIHAPN
jgi:hypothetical protein